jgi:hypothetical protein
MREAADLLERDGDEIARLRERIAELERGEILTDKELLSAIITGVMSSSQSDRNDALRKVQRHIIRVEQERDERETECEHTSEHRALAEARVVELEDEVARRRAFEQSMRCPQCDTLRLELGEARAALARLPADWSKDSSLAMWFPYTAEELTRLRAALADVSAAIGTHEFMDPPDGGSPSLAEQVRRMRAALAEAQRDAARYRTLKSWYYAADFIYPDAGSVLIFQLPTQGTRVSASLDATIDAAQEQSHASE